ncbi:cholesterol side-chain cleavage enzyme, mitochondrial isoform X1 [Hemitrygon akajei]|uniref:cholesterol side-chain cleavage enzyme, mitochondrial isoform X1 n=1 Tax=Hemitrygon akajei TaxID=2704970 RepID=UPI003BF9881E
MIRGSFRLSLSASTYAQRGSFTTPEHDFTLFPHRNHSVTSEPHIPSEQTVKSLTDIPGNWRKNWLNVYYFWRSNGFNNAHHLMSDNFNKYGPIYREKIGYYDSIYIINPADAVIMFKSEGPLPKRLKVVPWAAYRDLRKENYGVQLLNGENWKRTRLILNNSIFAQSSIQRLVPLFNEVVLDFVSMVHKEVEKSRSDYWKTDLTNDLFKFALESICYILYGERLDLLQRKYNKASQKFIDSVATMFHSTPVMLYIPPSLLKSINSKIWQQHIGSWDNIFEHANTYIKKAYRQFQQGFKNEHAFPGVLTELLLQGVLPFEDVRASVIDVMTGAIDTTSTTLHWMMYELAKHPHIQKNVRSEILEAHQKTEGDPVKMLKSVPLLKCVVKETLRLYPVAISLQRYLNEDTVLHNYHIPAGTLVQLGLYAMGRNSKIFKNPEQYNPERWLKGEDTHFKHLGFGFGPRQCVGRRIAESQMVLFMIHMLQNFKIETDPMTEVKSTFSLILIPDKPINLKFTPIK